MVSDLNHPVQEFDANRTSMNLVQPLPKKIWPALSSLAPTPRWQNTSACIHGFRSESSGTGIRRESDQHESGATVAQENMARTVIASANSALAEYQRMHTWFQI